MARPTIELPCGCVVNETHVVAMCLGHDRTLRELATADRRQVDDTQRQLIETIRELGR